MSAYPNQRQAAPPPAPGLVPRARRSGKAAWSYRWNRIQRNIIDGPWRSLGIMLANALGVAISIAIIAAAEGIQNRVNELLPANGSTNGQCPGPNCIDLGTIHQVLDQTRGVLINLAILATAAIVGLVTWITISQRRRAISLEVQAGQRRRDLIIEFLGEAFALCVAGGILGVILGLIVCNVIHHSITNLPMDPQFASVFSIFPSTTLLAFAATAGISTYFASHTDTRARL